MQSEELFAPSTEGRVFVRRWPVEGSGRAPIVLLHDSLGSVAQWRELPSKLAQTTSREVIAYDRLGFGQSDPRDERPSPGFVREEATSSFAAVRDALQLERFVLFGHSVGGAMALEIAAAEGARCVGVVSESAQAFVEPRTRDGIRINTFMLDADYGLRSFIEKLASINRGRAFFTNHENLGDYVLVDFIEHKKQQARGRGNRRAG